MRTFLLAFALFSLPLRADVVPGEWLVRGPGEAAWRLVRGEKPRLAGLLVQPNYVYRAAGSDPALSDSWGLKKIQAPAAWAVGPSAEVVVAVLDSGVDLNHEDLRHRLWRNSAEIAGNGKDDDHNGFADDVHGWNFVDGNANPADDNNHGTFCAGIIAAEADNGIGSRGVAPAARVLPVKMLDKSGMGTTASAIAAIRYAVENGARILNASWGGSNYDQALYDTVKWAGKQGALFIAAAGNDAHNNDVDPKPIYPAAFRLPTLISVAAYDAADKLAAFSNYGKETVHLGAPGVGIYSTIRGGYKIAEGTSYAAPFVSGVAALLAGFEALSLEKLRDRLLWTSAPLPYYEKERVVTAGSIDAWNAIRNFRPPRPAVPALWSPFGTHHATAHPYANKTAETFRIHHPGAAHVRAHFTQFSTEACCDKVILKDAEGKTVTEYRGELGDFWSADALGDTLVVEFTSDFSMTAYGFEIDRYEVSF